MTAGLRLCKLSVPLRSVKGQWGPSGAYFATMTRRHRIVAALFAALALVFAQLAVAAHACEWNGAAKAVQAAPEHECCNEDADGDGGSVRDGLCVEHCNYGDASFDGGQFPAGIADAPGLDLRVTYPEPAPASDGPLARRFASPATSPPATILFGVLRI